MDPNLEIDCERHGRSIAAAVCGHVLQRGCPLGFVENSSDPLNLQGWCFACEHVYSQEEDKTARFLAFCNHTEVCSRCYDEIKSRHLFPRPVAGPSH
jgi:hypothetical protein